MDITIEAMRRPSTHGPWKGVTPYQRFWERVSRNDQDECWEWTGSKSPRGYGRIYALGKARMAHRVSWAMANGVIPDNMCVCHRCDNPSCVNPKHLFLGTQADNIRDMWRKGRQSQPPSSAKLTTSQVRQIRSPALAHLSLRETARLFHVSHTAILDIRRGNRYKDV